MVIECKHVWDYISEYLDDSLSPETRDLVQAASGTLRDLLCNP